MLISNAVTEDESPPAVGLDHYHRNFGSCKPEYKHTFEELKFHLSHEDEAAMRSGDSAIQMSSKGSNPTLGSSSSVYSDATASSPPMSSDAASKGVAVSQTGTVTKPMAATLESPNATTAETSGPASEGLLNNKELHQHSLDDSARLNHVAEGDAPSSGAAANKTGVVGTGPQDTNTTTANTTGITAAGSTPPHNEVSEALKPNHKVTLEAKVEGYLRKGFGKIARQVSGIFFKPATISFPK